VPEPPPQGDRPPGRRLSRELRVGLVLALAALVAAAIYLVVRGSGDRFSYDGDEAPAFSFSYDDLDRVEPRGDELVRLESTGPDGSLEERLTAEPLEFEPSSEPVGGSLPLASDRFARRSERELAGFRLLEEGRTRLEITSGIEAYQLGYVAKVQRGEEGILIGKTYLIPEDADGARRGIALTLLQRTDDRKIRDAVREAPAGFFLNWPIRFWLQLATAVETPTPLERPVKSFEFG
jgi:hypothetical protein